MADNKPVEANKDRGSDIEMLGNTERLDKIVVGFLAVF
jgi:hypothetical protein